jgi:hypothetical protein
MPFGDHHVAAALEKQAHGTWDVGSANLEINVAEAYYLPCCLLKTIRNRCSSPQVRQVFQKTDLRTVEDL